MYTVSFFTFSLRVFHKTVIELIRVDLSSFRPDPLDSIFLGKYMGDKKAIHILPGGLWSTTLESSGARSPNFRYGSFLSCMIRKTRVQCCRTLAPAPVQHLSTHGLRSLYLFHPLYFYMINQWLIMAWCN